MNVGELFQRLSYGELSNLSLGSDGAGEIESSQQNRIVACTNKALVELYSIFTHNLNCIRVEEQEGLTRYELATRFALSNEDPDDLFPRYIQDSLLEPFAGDVMKIISVEEVYEPPSYVMGVAQPLVQAPEIRLLGYNKFMVKNPKAGRLLDVTYQVKHPTLSLPADPTEEIHLVPLLEEALEVRVAAMIYHSMNGEENVMKHQSLMARYVQIQQTVKMENLLQEVVIGEPDRLLKSGWR
jgi:hypothetical protein